MASAVECALATLRPYFRASRSERQVMRDTSCGTDWIMVMAEAALKAAQQTQLNKAHKGGEGQKSRRLSPLDPCFPYAEIFFCERRKTQPRLWDVGRLVRRVCDRYHGSGRWRFDAGVRKCNKYSVL